MGTQDIEVTVTYTQNTPPAPVTHTLTVHYVYADGSKAADDHTETLAEGASYSVTSPEISGYTPDQATVAGSMGTQDIEVTVTYKAGTPQLATGVSNHSVLLIALQYLCLVAGAVAVVMKQRKIRSGR